MIINIGSLNIDYVYHVDEFVSAGETISSISLETFPGGKGLNQTIAIANSNGEVMHCGCYGAGGDFLKELLELSGANVENLSKCDKPNGHAIIQVDKHGENSIVLYGGANYSINEKYIDKLLERTCKDSIVLFQNETSCIEYGIKKAKEMRFKVAINPAPMNERVNKYPLSLCDYIFLNYSEGSELSGESEIELIIKSLGIKYENSNIVLTLGEKGVWFINDKKQVFLKSLEVKNIVDTTAAGDTFIGYFLSSIDNGSSVEDALDLATRAAAISITRKGAAVSIPKYKEVVSPNVFINGELQ